MQKKLIAYLIQAHHQSEHFFDLVSQLNHKQVCFFVHIDEKSNQELFSRKVKKLDNIYFVQKRVNVQWGGFSQVQATLSMIELALKSDYSFQYFVLLSGVCYPIKSNNDIIKFFQNNHQNYIGTRDNGVEYRKYKYLYNMLIYKFIGRIQKYEKQYQKFQTKYYYCKYKIFSLITACLAPKNKWQEHCSYYSRMLLVVGRSHYRRILPRFHRLDFFINFILPAKKNPKNITKFYHGSQWWCLKQETVKFLLQFLTDKKNKSIIRFYKSTDISDERIFQTILKNTEYKKDHNLIHNINTYITRDKKSFTWPKILDEQDFLLIQKSKKLFARKFDFQKSALLKQKLKKLIT